MRISADSTVVASKHQVSADLGGERAMLHLKRAIYYTLNETGSRIWSMIQKPVRVSEIRDLLAEECGIPADQCERDLKGWMEQMAKEDLIEVCNEPAP